MALILIAVNAPSQMPILCKHVLKIEAIYSYTCLYLPRSAAPRPTNKPHLISEAKTLGA